MTASGTFDIDPLAELQREHAEVAGPLLERMERLAELLDQGSRVPPDVIAEGIELWQGYVHGVHARRLQLLGSAKAIACGPGLREVLEDHRRSAQRLRPMRALLERYRAGAGHGREALALALRAGARVDLVWVRFEEVHPLACLREKLGKADLEALTAPFRVDRADAEALEARVRAYLARPIGEMPDRLELACHVPSCRARAPVRYLGGSADELRLGPLPAGWVLRTDRVDGASMAAPGVLAVYCPEHAVASGA